MFCVYVHFFDIKQRKMKFKKSLVNQDSNPQFTYLWSYSDLPHDFRGKYNFTELSTDLLAIVPKRLFP